MKDEIFPIEKIENNIHIIRGKKVILDSDLAVLYGVETKALKQAVKRNLKRFPEDFMFLLSDQEFRDWRSQIVTSNPSAKMGFRYKPYAFTQNGIGMLSGILNSDRAIEVNIQIMRTFSALREMLSSNEMLRLKIEEMEKQYDHNFHIVFDAIKKLVEPPASTQREIGFNRK
jgi:hypothetical protein